MEKEKYTEMVGMRITKTQKDYLEDNGLNIRDVIEYHMCNNTNKVKRLLNQEKNLLNKIDSLETDLKKAKKDLEQVRTELGKAPTDDQETLDIIEAKSLILQRCKSKYGVKLSKARIMDYLLSPESNRTLQPIIVKYNIKDISSFKKEVLKRIDIDWFFMKNISSANLVGQNVNC